MSGSVCSTLSRLLVVLALALFGVPQSHADGTVANAGPAVQSKIDQAQGILTVQRPLLRAHLAGDSSPELLAPGGSVQDLPPQFAAAISLTPHLTFLPAAVRILPPVRGPPET